MQAIVFYNLGLLQFMHSSIVCRILGVDFSMDISDSRVIKILCSLRNSSPFSLSFTMSPAPTQRNLQVVPRDVFFPDTDVCWDPEQGTYGPCDPSRFPRCNPNNQYICYNRIPRQDKFYHDILMPEFYIDYDNVWCYPSTFRGCSSCNPGIYCLSERRCIQDVENFNDYPCEQWI